MTNQDTAQNHYQRLQVKPTASPQEIRRAYRDLSKLYHPDTTQLPPEVATEKFQILNEAYATLSSPERRSAYDYSIGISRISVIQAPKYLNRPASERRRFEKNSAYLDPTDRPLSPGELFALFILGVTFVGCLMLVFAISWSRGELVLHSSQAEAAPVIQSPIPDDAVAPATAPAIAPPVKPESSETAPAATEPDPASVQDSNPDASSERLIPANFSSKII